MSVLSWIQKKYPPGPSGFGFNSSADEVTQGVDLSGKNVVITGVNSGLGAETMRVLASRGAHIIGLARTLEKAEQACSSLGDKATPVACELSDLDSVRTAAEQIKALGKPIDILICNAGIMALPKLLQSRGIELQFATNHLGHFLLVNLLLDNLAEDARIVALSSNAHLMAPEQGIEFENLSGVRDYDPLKAYGQSKLANILMVKELTRRRGDRQMTANAVHPGVIMTNLGRNMKATTMLPMIGSIIRQFKNVHQGAATSCYVATSPALADTSGEYFSDCNIEEPLHHANDKALAQRLWRVSEELVGLDPTAPPYETA
ncbi:MAG: SDR family oxidoreductase [Alphaproteobacteria bacterium]